MHRFVRVLLLLLWLLFLGGSGVDLAEQRNKALYYFLRGNEHSERGELNQAIADFTEALRIYPQFAAAYHNRAVIETRRGEPDRAIADFAKALRFDPDNPATYLDRGRAYGAVGQYDLALADFNQALGLDPKNARAYRDRGAIHSRKGANDRAIADCKESLRLDPGDGIANNELAWLRATCADAKLRDGKEAVEYATKACKLSNWKLATALDTLAAAYAELGEFDEARKWIKQALDLASEDEKAELRPRSELYQAGKPYRVSKP
jgi:tetratricopeptide (TPR) repeat protein